MSRDADSLPADLDQLRALLLAERARHEATLAEISATVSSQQRTITQQEQTIARLLRKMHGPQQERIDPNQLTLFDTDELEELAAQKSPAASSLTRKRGHGRRSLPWNLPREQVVYELSEAQRQCPCCGETRQEIGRETSEQLEYVPGTMKVIEHVRLKYACRGCQEQVTLAAKPPQPIDKGLPGPGLLAWTVLSKYGDHLPLYRQEDILARYGVLLRRSTLCG